MPWQDAFRLHQRELVHNFQPSQDAAVKHRHVLRHDKVASEQGAGMLIQNREIVVRMRRRPSLQGQRSRSQIEISRASMSLVGGMIFTSAMISWPIERL